MKAAQQSAEIMNWIEPIQEEIEILNDKEIWFEELNPPPGIKILPVGLTFKLKRDKKKNPAMFKGRLDMRGIFQDGFDTYLKLYAPVFCIDLVCIILTVAHQKGWNLHQVYF